MGLLDKIKNENALREKNNTLYMECIDIMHNNSAFKNKLNTVSQLLNNHNINDLKKANSILFNPFLHTYKEYPIIDHKEYSIDHNDEYKIESKSIQLNMKQHLILEKNLSLIVPKIKSLQENYSMRKKLTSNDKPAYLIYVALFAFNVFSIIVWGWWSNYDWQHDNSHHYGVAALIILWRFIVLVATLGITGILWFIAFYNYDASKHYTVSKKNIIEIKKKEKELLELLTNANILYS